MKINIELNAADSALSRYYRYEREGLFVRENLRESLEKLARAAFDAIARDDRCFEPKLNFDHVTFKYLRFLDTDQLICGMVPDGLSNSEASGAEWCYVMNLSGHQIAALLTLVLSELRTTGVLTESGEV